MARFITSERMLNAVTATTTSGGFTVGNRRKLSLQVYATDITSGNGVFAIQVSNDSFATTDSSRQWVTYERLNVTTGVTGTTTFVATVTLSANTSRLITFEPRDHFEYMRVTCTVTTDGEFSAILAGID